MNHQFWSLGHPSTLLLTMGEGYTISFEEEVDVHPGPQVLQRTHLQRIRPQNWGPNTILIFILPSHMTPYIQDL